MNVENILFQGHAKLHARALDVAARNKSGLGENIDILQALDAHKTFREYGCSSLYEYALKFLSLSEDTACNYIAIARRSVEVPALKEQIKCGMISTSKARKICSVLTVENQSDWLELARTLTYRALQKEVADVNPKDAVVERLSYVTGQRLRLVIGVSEEFEAKLRRAQDLVSSSMQSAANFEQTLEVALDLFLEKRDPVRKAERVVSKKLGNKGADADVRTATDADKRDGLTVITESPFRKVAIILWQTSQRSVVGTTRFCIRRHQTPLTCKCEVKRLLLAEGAKRGG